MGQNSMAERTVKKHINEMAQSLLDILEADDGRTFEEKKAEAIKLLSKEKKSMMSMKEKSDTEEKNELVTKFWSHGEIRVASNEIILRRVKECDKEKFIDLQKENALMPAMFNKESFTDYLWEEHTKDTALMCSIILNAEYVGYCGIKNVAHDKWEISIELLKSWMHRGIGYASIRMMLDEIKNRLGVTEYRIRIDSDNYASQGLFEKLGVVPNGISELLLHGEEIEKWEEENLHLINDKLIAVAEKFYVEPRELLSHVLEYELVWEGRNNEKCTGIFKGN